MRIDYLLRLLILGLPMNMVIAQQPTVSGRVTDAETGEALAGVNITEVGTPNGTSTDSGGQYQITTASDSATLVFSFIGYEVVRENAGGGSIIDVALVPRLLEFGNVVVTALGLERESRELGYTVQSLEAKEISEVKSTNFIDNLAGKIAGVTISQGATGVGSTSKITIRGEASFTNNNPLFVVDGTPINNNSIVNFTDDAAAGFQEIDFGNGAMEVNPTISSLFRF